MSCPTGRRFLSLSAQMEFCFVGLPCALVVRSMDPPEVTGEGAEASSSSESFTSTESFVLQHLRGLQIQISRLHRMQLFLGDRIFARFERWEAQHMLADCFDHWKACVYRASGLERASRDSFNLS